MPTFDTALPATVMTDAGVVSYNNGTKLWMTRGGVRISFAIQRQNIDYDGKRAPTMLLDRVVSITATMSMRIFQASTLNLTKLMNHGGVLNIASLTIAEAAALSVATAASYGAFGDGVWSNASRFMEAGEYLTNVRGAFKWGAGTVHVAFPVAKVVWTGIAGADKDAAELDVTLECTQDLTSSTDTDVAPFSVVLNS